MKRAEHLCSLHSRRGQRDGGRHCVVLLLLGAQQRGGGRQHIVLLLQRAQQERPLHSRRCFTVATQLWELIVVVCHNRMQLEVALDVGEEGNDDLRLCDGK